MTKSGLISSSLNDFTESRLRLILMVGSIIAITITGALIYSNSLSAGFCFDDHPFIKDDHAIRMTEFNWSSIKFAALNGYPKYRLLPNLSFALNYYADYYNVTGYHIFNIGIHILTGIFFFFLFTINLQTISAGKRFSWPDIFSSLFNSPLAGLSCQHPGSNVYHSTNDLHGGHVLYPGPVVVCCRKSFLAHIPLLQGKVCCMLYRLFSICRMRDGNQGKRSHAAADDFSVRIFLSAKCDNTLV